ncbi:MAG: cytochrome c oxidase subunit II [Sphingomicrobium sp.]
MMKLMRWAFALAVAGLLPVLASATTPAAGTSAATTQAATTAAPAVPAGPAFHYVAPTPGIGVPDGRAGLQDQVTAIGREAQSFHNNWLLLMCFAISAFVLVLLAYAMFRFRRGANPTPSRTSHNTVIEVVWTVVPVFILVAIAIPSIRLIREQYSPPPADVTIKVTGNQWFWTYSYPDNGGFEIVSNQLKEKADVKPGDRFRTDADGPPMLAVDERIVIPEGKIVKFIITSADVIHSFAIPAFWTKLDANPGRLNETWVKVDRPGVYFGQCSELCGARHGYMPIAVEVVPVDRFNAWLASKGGTPKGAKMVPAVAPAATSGATLAAAQPAALQQPAINQAATAQN